MKISQAKSFTVGAILGAVLGAVFLAGIVHFLLIGVVAAGLGALLSRARRLALGRTRAEKRLKPERRSFSPAGQSARSSARPVSRPALVGAPRLAGRRAL